MEVGAAEASLGTLLAQPSNSALQPASLPPGLRPAVKAGGETLALPDASVGFVCASLVLCTVPDPARVVAEVRRVLRPGGRFVAIEHEG